MSSSNFAISGDSFSSIGAIGNANGCTELVLDETAEAFNLFCSALGWVSGSLSRTGADCQEQELTGFHDILTITIKVSSILFVV